MESKAAVLALSALAHEGRLAAFRLLVQAGPEGLPAGEIARGLDMPANSLSTNLSILAQAGLVWSRREGRFVHYGVQLETMGALLVHLAQECCGGRPEVCAPVADLLARAACCGAAAHEGAQP